MHFIALVVFLAWIPAGIYLFRRYPPRIAILTNFFAGWAILPGALYVPTTVEFPYWILGVCLPTTYILTKASVTALAAVLGFALFLRGDLKRFRPALCDLPIALWCCVPILSTLTHPATFGEALFGAAYQTLCWGVPWVLGRIYFSDLDSQLLAAKACVIAGICYVPICLLEFVTGPQLYALFYGYEPYRLIGADRYIGSRPIGFLEDGNQLGIWMAASALVAICLAVRKLTPRILNLPIGWVAAGLTLTTLLCQSAGSILLLIFLLPLALLRQRAVLRVFVGALILAIVCLALFRMSSHLSLRALAESNGLLRSIAYRLSNMGRHSFLWRLARDESHMAAALRHPLLGYGRWDWWQSGDARPWSLWLLIFGMYGVVGLGAFASILFLPVIRSIWPTGTLRSEDRSSTNSSNLRMALVALILMVAFDDLLNSAMILPYLLIMAGLASRRIKTPLR